MRRASKEERSRVMRLFAGVGAELLHAGLVVGNQARSGNDFQPAVGSQYLTSRQQMKLPPCAELAEPTGEMVPCQSCNGRTMAKLYRCKLYGPTLPTIKQQGTRSCIGCTSYHS